MRTTALPKLLAVTCPTCGRHLAETIPTATVYCPACCRWTAGKKLAAIQRERATRRQVEAGKANLPTVSVRNISHAQESEKGRTSDKVAAAGGLKVEQLALLV